MIDILLATYNGEKYIDTQISSVVNQTYTDWKLYIHDDGSKDTTVEKIKHWCGIDSRIQFIDDKIYFHNPANHFMHLMNFSKAEYICFSDQDDLWLENKLEKMVECFDAVDKTPKLLVSGCYLWKSSSNEIVPKINFNPAYSLEQFLFLNGGLQGCSMMFNSSLREIVLSQKTKYLYMHDYLVSLAGFTFGKVEYIYENLFLYRQHEKNVSVHLERNKKEYAKRIIKNRTVPVIYAPAYKASKSFYDSFHNLIPDDRKKIFEDYFALKNKSFAKRLFSVLFSKFSLGKNGKIKLLTKIFCRPFWREDYE